MPRKKNFVLNDKKATGKEIIKEGDVVKLYISDDTYNKFKTDSFTEEDIKISNHFNIKDSIVYEDKDIILINKPANIEVTGIDSLTSLIHKKYENSNFKPMPCHRLDRNTTGLILFAKN